jgi:hypothetical protein
VVHKVSKIIKSQEAVWRMLYAEETEQRKNSTVNTTTMMATGTMHRVDQR